MKIGLYFGSFNPIHTGHLIIAEHIAQHCDVEQVWLVVSPQNPHKKASTLLNEYDRLHLVNIAVEGNKKLKASEIEFKLVKPSFTIDTLVYLQEKYPQNQFYIIIGSDSYQNLPKWKNYEILIKNYTFIVYLRPHYPIDTTYLPHNVQVLSAPMLDISSTLIRHLIKEKKSIRYLVPDRVREEIETNRYFQ